jgi:hypothetical protein
MSCCNLTRTKWILPLTILTCSLIAVASISIRGTGAEEKKESATMLRHVVLFKFKESSSEADIQKILSEFELLPKKIPQIAGFEWGTNNSPEGLAEGFTHCFFISFKSEKDRDAYLPHAEHKAFVDIVKPHLEKVLVVDYWAK